MTLTEIANKYGTDKGTIKKHDWEGDRHHYSEVYARYLDQVSHQPLTILEIGIGSGPSLRMWYEYLPNARIYALDIDDKTMYNNDRVQCYKGDQSNRDHLKKLMQIIGKPLDVIIDDGGHYMNQQQISLGCLFPYLDRGGLYFIEDLHTSYWPHGKPIYNGVPVDINEDRSNTTVAMINNYERTGKWESQYMTPAEIEYLNNTVADCTLHDTVENTYGPNHLCAITKVMY